MPVAEECGQPCPPDSLVSRLSRLSSVGPFDRLDLSIPERLRPREARARVQCQLSPFCSCKSLIDNNRSLLDAEVGVTRIPCLRPALARRRARGNKLSALPQDRAAATLHLREEPMSPVSDVDPPHRPRRPPHLRRAVRRERLQRGRLPGGAEPLPAADRGIHRLRDQRATRGLHARDVGRLGTRRALDGPDRAPAAPLCRRRGRPSASTASRSPRSSRSFRPSTSIWPRPSKGPAGPRNLVRFLLGVAAVRVPSFFMGITTPAYTKALAAGRPDMGRRLARLYALNVFGASAGRPPHRIRPRPAPRTRRLHRRRRRAQRGRVHPRVAALTGPCESEAPGGGARRRDGRPAG